MEVTDCLVDVQCQPTCLGTFDLMRLYNSSTVMLVKEMMSVRFVCRRERKLYLLYFTLER